MKRYVFIIVLIMWIIMPFSANASNLIQNGGFEYDFFGWDIINYLGNSLNISNNSMTATAVEGGKNLHVMINSSDPVDAWKTSIKYPISTIMSPGETWVLRFSVKKLSQDGVISAGLMDNRPPWESLFWSGEIDLKDQTIGSVVEYKYEFNIAFDLWFPAVVLNLGAINQDIIIDNVRLEPKSQIIPLSTTTVSGSVSNVTNYNYSKVYVVFYPDGDYPGNDVVNTKIVKIPDVPKLTTKSWSTVIPAGRQYTVEVFLQVNNIYKRITNPWLWRITANTDVISGVDTQIICYYYKSSTLWATLSDACWK